MPSTEDASRALRKSISYQVVLGQAELKNYWSPIRSDRATAYSCSLMELTLLGPLRQVDRFAKSLRPFPRDETAAVTSEVNAPALPHLTGLPPTARAFAVETIHERRERCRLTASFRAKRSD